VTALARAASALASSASDERFGREQVVLFDRGWRIVADGAELAPPGSYVSADVGRSPLLLVRAHDGVLRAFHNLCRHRGMALVTDCGSFTNAIACPYHAWRFGLDGALKAVPQRAEQFPGIELADWPLLPASFVEWHGMVLANPDPSAVPPADLLGLGTDVVPLPQVAQLDLEAGCDWKVLVEHHLDAPGTELVFPNLLVASQPDLLVTATVVPLAPDRSRVELRARAAEGVAIDAVMVAARESVEACMPLGAPSDRAPGPAVASFRRRLLDEMGDC
jgi:phenylpropionate dioxygenase-like ring-hydroxylating dioxygenase large terminal subunit